MVHLTTTKKVQVHIVKQFIIYPKNKQFSYILTKQLIKPKLKGGGYCFLPQCEAIQRRIYSLVTRQVACNSFDRLDKLTRTVERRTSQNSSSFVFPLIICLDYYLFGVIILLGQQWIRISTVKADLAEYINVLDKQKI